MSELTYNPLCADADIIGYSYVAAIDTLNNSLSVLAYLTDSQKVEMAHGQWLVLQSVISAIKHAVMLIKEGANE